MRNSNTKSGKEYIFLYDWIRVIGTLMVVIGHSTFMAWSEDMGSISIDLTNVAPNFNSWHHALLTMTSFVYMFHMPLFFALSGAVFAIGNKVEDLGVLAKKKFERLIIPYYLGAIFWMFPLKYISGFYSDKVSTLRAFFRFTVGQNAMGHLWFLPALFMCFMLFWIIQNYVNKMGGGHGHVLIISMIVSFGLSGINVIYGFGFPRCLSYIIYFAIGFGFECYRKKGKQWWELEAGVFLVTSVVLYSQVKVCVLIEDVFTLALIGIFWCFSLCMLICRVKFLNNRVVRRLSADSFIVYILHEPINFVLLKYGNDMINTNSGTALFFSLRSWINVIFCFAMAELIHCVINMFRKRKKIL